MFPDLQLLRSLLQLSLSGSVILDGLAQLIHLVVQLLHPSSQLIFLLTQLLQLHLSYTALLFCLNLLLAQQSIALRDRVE